MRRISPGRGGGGGPRGEAGFTTASYLMVVGFTLVVFVWFTNLAVYLYGRGVVRSAVDEAARAGSRVGADSARQCQERARDVLGNLLGGTMGQGVAVACAEEDGVMRARANVRFQAWLPPVPDWSFQLTAAVIKERVP
ncbi:MAG: hypothetical protein M3P85_02655 [Actinomycetota bacterium]|nr:hypothetical protein [Actinomycetota bacterium]